LTDEKEEKNMAAPAAKPIRPTTIKLGSDKEFNDFIDWAEGRKKVNNDGIKRAREMMKHHKPSSPRK
jgi:hypothetical protein